jgi:excisionase family DNA binding protein
MAVAGFMSVPEASERLGVDDSRVRALLAAGQLDGEKLGGRWVVSEESVRARLRLPHARGRQLQPANAWTALLYASGQESSLGAPRDRARVRRLLDDRGIAGLAPRLRGRADLRRFHGHPGVLSRIARADLRLSGANAANAHGLGLVPGDEVDGYIAHGNVDALVAEFALQPRERDPNVLLRVLPAGLCPIDNGVAPLACVALDLAEQSEPRAAQIGREALARLDSERRWRAIERV